MANTTKKEITNPVKAIRAKCAKCKGRKTSQIIACDEEKCPLYAFRLGINPYRTKRHYSDEEKKVISERMKAIRARKAEKAGD